MSFLDQIVKFLFTSTSFKSWIIRIIVCILLNKLFYKYKSFIRKRNVEAAIRKRMKDCNQDEEEKIAIIGSGMGGLAAAVKLKLAGHPFVMYEKSHTVGGTWNFNRYPGAACDVPSHLYSFSFKLNPNWSTKYPPQAEILKYLQSVATYYDLWPHIQFNTTCEAAKFNKETNKWSLYMSGEEGKEITFIHRSIIFACGQLNIPSIPNINGIDQFKNGPSIHSAKWDSKINLHNKNIAVIGNGASCIQLLPNVAKTANHTTLYTRSANWIEPRFIYNYPKWLQTLFKYIPWLNYIYRCYHWGFHEIGYLGFLKANPVNKFIAKLFLWKMHKETKGRPDLKEKVIPNYKMGCKRILLSANWFKTLRRDDVTVVNDPISHITQKGIAVTEKKTGKINEKDFDMLIWCTGFRSTDFLFPIDIEGINPVTGEEGYNLAKDAWVKKTRAYRGMTAVGFPNMFIMYGPNTNLGHNSIIFMLECQANYIADFLSKVTMKQYKRFHVTPKAVADENIQIQKRMKQTVWTDNCNSWYKKDGEIINNCPWTTTEYWWMTRNAEVERDFIITK